MSPPRWSKQQYSGSSWTWMGESSSRDRRILQRQSRPEHPRRLRLRPRHPLQALLFAALAEPFSLPCAALLLQQPTCRVSNSLSIRKKYCTKGRTCLRSSAISAKIWSLYGKLFGMPGSFDFSNRVKASARQDVEYRTDARRTHSISK